MAREDINKGTTRLRLFVREAKNLYRISNVPCNASCLVRLFYKDHGIYHGGNSDVDKRSIFRSAVEPGTSNPVWNKLCQWDMDGKENAMIEISLWDSGALPGNENLSLCIGQAVINVAKLSFPMYSKKYELDVHVRRSLGSSKAKILVEIDYTLIPWEEANQTEEIFALQHPELSPNNKSQYQVSSPSLSDKASDDSSYIEQPNGSDGNGSTSHMQQHSISPEKRAAEQISSLFQYHAAHHMDDIVQANHSHTNTQREFSPKRLSKTQSTDGTKTIDQKSFTSMFQLSQIEKEDICSDEMTVEFTLTDSRSKDLKTSAEADQENPKPSKSKDEGEPDSPKDLRVKAVIGQFLREGRRIKLFEEISDDFFFRLCQRLRLVSYEAEERIVEAGTPGTSVYFIVSGTCAVAISGKVVAKLKAGDYFGEVAMLLSETRTADIFSLTTCELLELTNTDLWDVINEYPTSGNHMYMSLKRTAVASMKRNIGAMCVVESHPSAMESNMDPLSALNSTDRRRRVAQWREIYESDKPIPDQIAEFQDVVDDSIDPMAEAMKLSGVGQKVVNVIRTMKLFLGAPQRAQAQVVARLKSVMFDQGETIIQAGDIGTCMYIINNGKAEVIVDDKRVSELATGNFFGEVALMGNQKRTATVKAMTKCELLQLDQDDVWTVFNMFPSMYKTLTEVAEARIKKAQQEFESPDPDANSENDTWKEKLRKQKRGIFRVKFRAPFDKFTPEEIGSTQRLSFAVSLSQVKVMIPVSKEDSYSFTISKEDEVVYNSPVVRALQPAWPPKINLQPRLDYENDKYLVFRLLQNNRKVFNSAKTICVGTSNLTFSSALSASSRTSEQTFDLYEDDNGRERKSSSIFGKVQVTVHVSRPKQEPYVIFVPIFHDKEILPITDHTGRKIMLVRWRNVMDIDVDTSARCKLITLIDIGGLDGSYKGQVATEVTLGSHARSRLSNHFDIHWATVKTKLQVRGKGVASTKTVPKNLHGLDVTPVSKFKVVPTFQEYVISNSSAKAKQVRLFSLRHKIADEDTMMGSITLGPRESTWVRVEVMPGQDALRLIQAAVGLAESQRLAPLPGSHTWMDGKRTSKHLLPDTFDNNYFS